MFNYVKPRAHFSNVNIDYLNYKMFKMFMYIFLEVLEGLYRDIANFSTLCCTRVLFVTLIFDIILQFFPLK